VDEPRTKGKKSETQLQYQRDRWEHLWKDTLKVCRKCEFRKVTEGDDVVCSYFSSNTSIKMLVMNSEEWELDVIEEESAAAAEDTDEEGTSHVA